eukprot:COSAG05_NODE_2233_length_3359_cov_2.310123_3_plen_72_part_01
MNQIYSSPNVDRLFARNSTLVEGRPDGNRGADINRETKGTSKSQATTSVSQNASGPNVATATSSSWSTIDDS